MLQKLASGCWAWQNSTTILLKKDSCPVAFQGHEICASHVSATNVVSHNILRLLYDSYFTVRGLFSHVYPTCFFCLDNNKQFCS